MAKKTKTLKETLPWILVICGAIGFIAAFVLTVDKFKLLENPAYIPSCNLSPILSCKSVMTTEQASVFGFANSLLGIMGFAVVTTIGMALVAGAKFKRWFWLGLNVGALLGYAGIKWLMFESIFRIGALCPYCMVVWVITFLIFWYTTLYNIREGHIRLSGNSAKIGNFLQRHHGDVVILWFVAVSGLILNHFWYYWSTLL